MYAIINVFFKPIIVFDIIADLNLISSNMDNTSTISHALSLQVCSVPFIDCNVGEIKRNILFNKVYFKVPRLQYYCYYCCLTSISIVYFLLFLYVRAQSRELLAASSLFAKTFMIRSNVNDRLPS